MTPASLFTAYGDRLRQFMARSLVEWNASNIQQDDSFNHLALELFALQFQHNAAYRTWCDSRGASLSAISHWSEIPALPTSAFKELEVTSLAEAERAVVFHSSGTTEQRPSRHFHNAASLALYEASLLTWFRACVGDDAKGNETFLSLTPPANEVPHSSLAHMFETLCREQGSGTSAFLGGVDASGAWTLEPSQADANLQAVMDRNESVLLMGTAFNFVHLLDHLSEDRKAFQLPPGSRVIETGGYKGRSRVMEKSQLHQLISERFGVALKDIVCEYGMSELSSQAYDSCSKSISGSAGANRSFQFPPWARVQIVSPETGREVADGETGLIRVHDLANIRSVLAMQTEDLGVRRGDGFELLGRAVTAEARGCSLMASSR